MSALVLSDGKPGHLNQSLAFVELTGLDYDLLEVHPRNRLAKGLSYLLDRAGISCPALLTPLEVSGDYRLVVSTGSDTYYANKLLARRLGARSVAIMLPRGFAYDFDLILAPQHDRPPRRKNLLSLPINVCHVVPQGVFKPREGRDYIALVIGGDSAHCRLNPDRLLRQIGQVFELFPETDKVVTTSRRTPRAVEDALDGFNFAEKVIYSKTPVNPIPDFLASSSRVFLTGDSTSMISEAVSFGTGSVEILPVDYLKPENKIRAMITTLEAAGCLHVFDGVVGHCNRKIDLRRLLEDRL